MMRTANRDRQIDEAERKREQELIQLWSSRSHRPIRWKMEEEKGSLNTFRIRQRGRDRHQDGWRGSPAEKVSKEGENWQLFYLPVFLLASETRKRKHLQVVNSSNVLRTLCFPSFAGKTLKWPFLLILRSKEERRICLSATTLHSRTSHPSLSFHSPWSYSSIMAGEDW